MPTRAPIDPELLRPVLEPDLSAARTLPPAAYTSDDVLEWERRNFFEGSWVCVGRAEDLATPGDQRAVRIGEEGILLVRGKDAVLRGFFNSCRHRGHELLAEGEQRNLAAIKCPYHAWVYGLDGQLGAAPRFSAIPGFDRSEYPLVPARVTEWMGWVFVNADGGAPSFDAFIGNLGELLAPWEPERCFTAEVHDYVARANWKTIVENYQECYHCPSIHPALCKVTPVNSGEYYQHTGAVIGGSMELMDFAQTMSFTGESDGVNFRALSDKQRREVYYYGVFPNLLISLHPDYIMTHRLEPIAPGEVAIECAFLFPPEARDLPEFSAAYASEFWDVTNREDFEACESVFRGMGSTGFRQGPFAREEDEVHAFMLMIARGYEDGRITRAPDLEYEAPSRDEVAS
jgi:phenylpropionate dioxygenase-like ring-hydroxylating dioxygenase large terminal subunit